MSNDRERYAYAANQCLANARAAPGAEIQAMWRSVASSYVFLSQRADRLDAEEQERARTERGRWDGAGMGNIS